jgi:hypothetical protein
MFAGDAGSLRSQKTQNHFVRREVGVTTSMAGTGSLRSHKRENLSTSEKIKFTGLQKTSSCFLDMPIFINIL